MLRHFITFIDYAKLIEMQANQVSYTLPVEKNKKISKNSVVQGNRQKVLKKGRS